MVALRLSPEVRTELSANLRMAGPIVAAQLTLMSFSVADVLMAGRLGEFPLAAIAIGANLWMQAFVLFMGIFMAVSPIVAHRVGAGQSRYGIGEFVRATLPVAVVLGFAWTLMVRLLAEPIIALLGVHEVTAALALRYLQVESWGAPFFCLFFVLRYAAEGMGVITAVLAAGLAGLVVKVAVNLVLVFGIGPVPALGVEGCAWGTVVASAVMAGTFALQFAGRRRLAELRLWRVEPYAWRLEGLEVLRLGVPIGLVLFAEAAFFGMVALLMARFGEAAMAAHQVALNFVSVVFMVPLGISLATSVRVGYAAGAGTPEASRLRGHVGMGLGVAFGLAAAVVMGLKPEWIVALYTSETSVRAAAETFLRYAALFQIFDCLQVTANGALRGLRDVRVPLAITLSAYWIFGIPTAYHLAFTVGQGPQALWWGLILGLALAAMGLVWRFSWRSAVFRPRGL